MPRATTAATEEAGRRGNGRYRSLSESCESFAFETIR